MKHVHVIVIVIIASVAGCSTTPSSRPVDVSPPSEDPPHEDPPKATHAPSCSDQGSILGSLMKPGAIILLGEVHGTQEIPSFVAASACHAAEHGHSVRVALELPRTDQKLVDAYLQATEPEIARDAMLGSPFWNRPYQDGRSSVAMLELIDNLRSQRQAGHPIDVLFFDVESQIEMPMDRDFRMAERVVEAVREHPNAVFIVLAGNMHTRITQGTPWDDKYQPMGLFLLAKGLSITSLNCASPRGTAWVCSGSAASDCKASEWQCNAPTDGQPSLVLNPEPSKDGHQGVYLLDSLTASPPFRAP